MYLVATMHLVFAGFRFYKSVFLDPKGPISYLRNPFHWEFLGLIILLCIQTWLGDALAIYRCYFVWNNNLWLISIPVCLLLVQIGINFYVMYWLRHPFILGFAQINRLRSVIYPLAFAQNVMTTSLIILKILLQHRVSKKTGTVDVGSKLSLMRVVRIVIESAAIYTVQILVLVIVSSRRDNFQYVVQSAVTPSIGITFVLLAIRVEGSRHDKMRTISEFEFRNSMISRWAPDPDSETCSEDYQHCNSLSAGEGNAVTEQEVDAQGESGVESHWDVESSANSVVLIFSILMHLVATIHLVFAAFRFYKSIFLNVDPNGPISYLRDPNHWEFLGLIILLCIQTWLGDALVIYRCYFVWNNNLWLISIPVCILLGQIGINAYVMNWLRDPVVSARAQVVRLRSSIYPLAFTQNFITTSLIILKVLLQHRASKKAGLVDVGSKFSLMRVVRVVLESAAIYTIQILVLVILYFRNDNFQYVVQSAVTPSIGITFVLLAIRLERSRNEHTTTRIMFGPRSTVIPRWAHDNDSDYSEEYRDCGSLPTGDGNEVVEQKIDAQGKSGVNSNWDVESSNSAEPSKVTSVSL
ncbi:hypothetical protein D9619_004324 [Psilocybe cf. subviscida]|uniref:Uncharacterized protein n=1 Tax=Psilocybe cf. subviscida TaxID=2480587 RepID=A0A8H5BQB3_9AGAR|nr:hypothetical protein D9619_004324 [Psilocybe cf. subviscida]